MHSFIDRADEATAEFDFHVHKGYNAVQLPSSPPTDVAFIAGVAITDNPALLGQLRLSDRTGMLLTQMRAETWRSLSPEGELYIPFGINDEALGVLPNLSHSCRYRLDFEALEDFHLTGELRGYMLPEANNSPAGRIPPHLGTAQFWSEIYGIQVGPNGPLQINRVGNYIRGIGIRSDVFPDNPKLRWDDTWQPIEFERRGDIYWYTFEEWLPTVQSTYLSIEGEHDAGTFDYIVNDIALPIPLPPEQRR